MLFLCLNIKILLILIYYVINGCTLNITINNDEESMFKLSKNINSYLDYDEIFMNFDDDYYKIDDSGNNIFNVASTLIFYSANGTTFDFQGSNKTRIIFYYQNGVFNKKIIFRNITFLNYDNNSIIKSYLIYLKTFDDNDKFTIEFDNCMFKDIKGLVYYNEIMCTKSTQSSPQVIFNNCKFM